MSWFSCRASLCISDVIITGGSGARAQVMVLAALRARCAQAIAARPLLSCSVDQLPEHTEEQATRLELFLCRREGSTYVVSL
jgi:hypothetical protein